MGKLEKIFHDMPLNATDYEKQLPVALDELRLVIKNLASHYLDKEAYKRFSKEVDSL